MWTIGRENMRSMIFGLIPILLAGVFALQSAATSVPMCPEKQQAFRDPVRRVRARYPKEALKAGTSGSVHLRAVVNPHGQVEQLTVLDGPAIFEKPTLDAVRKWRFYPVLVKGEPVQTTFSVEMRFDLLLEQAVPSVALESPQAPDPPLPPMEGISNNADGAVYRASAESGIVGPKVIYQVDPEFSEEARKAKKSGYVTIRLVVGTDGLPHDLRLRCGAEAGLNEKALEAVRQWKFTPGTKDGKPVQIETEVEVEFHLF
jgi:TonB family protein